jgi:hypothetical protein
LHGCDPPVSSRIAFKFSGSSPYTPRINKEYFIRTIDFDDLSTQVDYTGGTKIQVEDIMTDKDKSKEAELERKLHKLVKSIEEYEKIVDSLPDLDDFEEGEDENENPEGDDTTPSE